MSDLVVLDAAVFDTIDSARGRRLRGYLETVIARSGDVRCAAVTLAEVCRGIERTRRVESALRRRRGGRRITIVPTDERLAKRVGTILHGTGSGSERLADAHVVALCADADLAVVFTSDPGDIRELAAAIPGTRVVTRRPSLQ